MFDFGDLSDAESGDEGHGESPEELQQQRKPDASIKFHAGDVVKARFQQGCWYLASIFKENADGSYTISWKDGDGHDRVKNAGELIYIRPGDSKSASWSPKDPEVKPTMPPPKPKEAQQSGEDAPIFDSKVQDKGHQRHQSGDVQTDSGSGYQSVADEKKKWDQWDEQQRRFRRELEQRDEKEDQKWFEARMAKLQKELKDIDQLSAGAKKARLRKLQLELHPDKQPERIRAKAQQLFLIVQGKWEANEAAFQRESQYKTKFEEEQAQREARQAREERRRRQRSQEERDRQEKRRQETERILREEKERQEREAEEKRRHSAESRAKQAEQELKRFKEAAARQRSKQMNEKAESASQPKTSGSKESEKPPNYRSHTESSVQADSPFLSHGQPGQKENAPPNKETESIHIRLRINGINSKRPTFSVKNTATVGSIRESLESASAIPISLQKVFIGERELFDFETLKPLIKSGNLLDLDITEVPQKGNALAERVRRNWRMLQHAPDQMKSDKNLVLDAVRQSWEALQFAADHLKADRQIALVAVEQDGLALEHVSETLHTDREIMLLAVQRTWRALRYAAFDIAGDLEIAFIAVHQDWRALQYLSPELCDNKELLETAVQQSGLALRYASKRLQKDHAIVLAAVRQNGNAFSHAAIELRADRQFVLAAVWKNGAALRYVDPDLRVDKEVALAAVSGWD